jgi:hypothetical protein
MPKKFTTDDFKQKLLKVRNNEYELIGEYTKSNEKTLFRHISCGHEWYTKPELMIRRKNPVNCPRCSRNLRDSESFQNEIGKDYKLLSEFSDVHSHVRLKHLTCGHEWNVKPSNFLNGTRCPYCSNRKTQEQFEDELKVLYNNDYSVIGKYIDSNTKIRIKHNICGHEYETTPINILGTSNRKGRQCPYCFGTPKKTTEDFKEEVKALVGNDYKVLGEYIDNKHNILMKHIECGHEWNVRPNNFLSLNTRCPLCNSPKKEIEVYNFLLQYFSEDEILRNDYTLLKNLEIDFYIPSKKFAIEFDGLYWHSDKFKDRNYHINKTEELNKLGIRLIHIFEDEWITKKDIVKSKILHILGLNKNPKIYARKCTIKEIDVKSKNQFLNKNHIQGSDNSNIKLGMFYKSELVAVMTFAKSRMGIGHNTKNNDLYEISRFASDINYIIIGGFSKILSYFNMKYNYTSLITYADLRWSSLDNNLYEKNNFVLKFKNKPNYWYCNKTERFHRFSFRKDKIKERFPDVYDSTKTEFEMMDQTEYTRIWDCGTLSYELRKNKLS